MEEKNTKYFDKSNSKTVWINAIILVILVLLFMFLLRVLLDVNVILVILIGSVFFTTIMKIISFESHLVESIEKLQMKDKLNEAKFKVLKNSKEEESKKVNESENNILPVTDLEIAFTYLVEHIDSLLLSYIIYLELYADFDEGALTHEEFILMKTKTMAKKIFEGLEMEEPKLDMFPISTMYMKSKVFKDGDFLEYF